MKIYTNRYCVYTHSVNGSVFYVGKGRSTRPFEARKRNKLWADMVESCSGVFDVDIISWHEDNESAIVAEAVLIREKNPSCNMVLTDGYTTSDHQKKRCSQTHKGKILSESTRVKISNSLIGRQSTLIGKPRAESTKEKIAASMKGKIPHNKGIPCSKETANMLRQSGMKRAKPIYCIEAATFYCSAKYASKALGIPWSTLKGHLAGTLSHARGYHFKYA